MLVEGNIREREGRAAPTLIPVRGDNRLAVARRGIDKWGLSPLAEAFPPRKH